MYKPERVSSGGKGVAAVTSATRVRFALGGTIYIAWVPGKEVKTPFSISFLFLSPFLSPPYPLKTINLSFVSFGTDEAGSIYAVGYEGMIYRLDFAGSHFEETKAE